MASCCVGIATGSIFNSIHVLLAKTCGNPHLSFKLNTSIRIAKPTFFRRRKKKRGTREKKERDRNGKEENGRGSSRWVLILLLICSKANVAVWESEIRG